MNAPHTPTPPAWARLLSRYNHWLMFDLGGGPRPWKLATVINVLKGGSLPVMAGLIAYYAGQTPAATSTAAWLYAALHGAYGLIWVLKDLTYPDRNWQGRTTLASTIVGVLGLGAYWLPGWLLISGVALQNYPLPAEIWFTICTVLCVLGCVIMMAADVQKYTKLQIQPGLITTGMFKYVRHPNYLGEMMVYGSFALLAWHWIPVVVLAYFWLTMFAPNMANKEASLSRHPGWAEYKRRSWWLLPGLV